MTLKRLRNQNGSVLVIALMMLVVLMIIGIAATNTSTVELQIAGNDKVEKQTFYQADGGSEVGISIVEENILKAGFDSVGGYHGVTVANPTLYLNETMPNAFDAAMTRDGETTEFRVFGRPAQFSPGSGMQMAAGYEGKGKGLAGGGAFKVFDIQSHHDGTVNSKATIRVQWRHML